MSRICSRSIFFAPAWKHYVVSANQKRGSVSTMTLSLSDEHIFVFIDATVQAVTILSSSMLQSKLWLSVFIDATVSHDFLTPLWGLVTTAGARKSYTSVARKLGNGLTGELVLKFSTECVYIWHMEFTSGFSKPVNCLRVKGKKTLGFTSTETIKAYLGRGSWGVRNFISYTYSLHCHHQNDSALRLAAVWAILLLH